MANIATANDWVRRDEAVQQASYSTGANGNRLKWLPTRPTDRQVRQAALNREHVVQSVSTSDVRLAQQNARSPLDDPFGDRRGRSAGTDSLPNPNDIRSTPRYRFESDSRYGRDNDRLAPLETPRGLDAPLDVPEQVSPQFPAGGSLPPLDRRSDWPSDTGVPRSRDIPDEDPGLQPTQPQDTQREPAPLDLNRGLDFGDLPKRDSEDTSRKTTLEGSYARGQVELDASCPSLDQLKKIAELGTDIKPGEGVLPPECPLVKTEFSPRDWAPTTYAWKATGLCHKPLYFEDVHLERYGHSWGPYIQPIISGGHFFLTLPVLPYKMGLNTPNECIYTLGYYRPGNCAPYMLDPLPLSVRAALFEAGAWVGAAALIP